MNEVPKRMTLTGRWVGGGKGQQCVLSFAVLSRQVGRQEGWARGAAVGSLPLPVRVGSQQRQKTSRKATNQTMPQRHAGMFSMHVARQKASRRKACLHGGRWQVFVHEWGSGRTQRQAQACFQNAVPDEMEGGMRSSKPTPTMFS